MGRRDRRRKSGAGAFFGGTFFGFLLGLGAVAGIGAFAYFKASPAWINETFKTEINLGNDEINNKTLNDVVNTLVGIGENSDSYSLNDLKNDFGVELPNDLLGINVEDLKDVPLADLADAAQNKLSNISAKELENLFSSSALDAIMQKSVVYYYFNGAIYKDTMYQTPVTFNYTIEENGTVKYVKIKTFEPIAIGTDNTVEITLQYLPLAEAIDTFVGNLGDNVSLVELKLDYGVDLPDFLYNGNETRKVNELDSIISELTVGKMLNVKLDTISTKYYIDSNNNSVKDSGEAEASNIVIAIKDTSIDGLSSKINSLQLKDIFPERTGVLSLMDGEVTISEIPNEINKIIKTTSINTLIEKGVIDTTGLSSSQLMRLRVPIQFDTNGDGSKESTTVGALSLQQFMVYFLTMELN